jgi:hypothetical protein
MRGVRAAVLAAAFLAGAAVPALAQDAGSKAGSIQEQFQAKWEAKQKEPWLADFPWEKDYDAALEKAKAEKKLIAAYFSRSYSP